MTYRQVSDRDVIKMRPEERAYFDMEARNAAQSIANRYSGKPELLYAISNELHQIASKALATKHAPSQPVEPFKAPSIWGE